MIHAENERSFDTALRGMAYPLTEDPLVDTRNSDRDDARYGEFRYDNFSEHPNIGIQFGSW